MQLLFLVPMFSPCSWYDLFRLEVTIHCLSLLGIGCGKRIKRQMKEYVAFCSLSLFFRYAFFFLQKISSVYIFCFSLLTWVVFYLNYTDKPVRTLRGTVLQEFNFHQYYIKNCALGLSLSNFNLTVTSEYRLFDLFEIMELSFKSSPTKHLKSSKIHLFIPTYYHIFLASS